MMNKKQSITKSALLVVDAQESFRARGAEVWAMGRPTTFMKSLKELIDLYRTNDLPVFFILHSDEDPGFEKESPYYRVLDELEYRGTDPCIHKIVHNSFTGTNLQYELTQRGINRVLVTGIRTEQCCETTTRVASDLGYDVDFITEATLTFPIVNDITGAILSAESILERTEFVLRNRFARISTVDAIRQELKEAINE